MVQLANDEAEGGHHGNATVLELSLAELDKGLSVLALAKLEGVKEPGGLSHTDALVPPVRQAVALTLLGGGGLLVEEGRGGEGGRGSGVGWCGGDGSKGRGGGEAGKEREKGELHFLFVLLSAGWACGVGWVSFAYGEN